MTSEAPFPPRRGDHPLEDRPVDDERFRRLTCKAQRSRKMALLRVSSWHPRASATPGKSWYRRWSYVNPAGAVTYLMEYR